MKCIKCRLYTHGCGCNFTHCWITQGYSILLTEAKQIKLNSYTDHMWIVVRAAVS